MKNPCHLFLALPLALSLIGSALAQDEPQHATPVQLVDALNGVFGQHAARAVHAKGIVLEGRFTPSPSAASISKAPHLQATAVPVTVRFSNFAGIPDIPDNHALASPRGLAVRFALPGGGSTDIVAHSFNGFPSPTADDFRDLLIALGTSGPDAPKPTSLDGYLASHPVAKAFLTTPKPAPESFATLPYYGVNTFRFINEAGTVTFGRYQFLPVGGAHYLSDAQAAKAQPDYLSEEILQHVEKSPVRFKLVVQMAEPGDRLDDPSVAWPANRPLVELGTLDITRAVADNVAAQKSLMFLPNNVPAGIEPQDPMINTRSAAYPVSFGRRQ